MNKKQAEEELAKELKLRSLDIIDPLVLKELLIKYYLKFNNLIEKFSSEEK